MITNKQHTILPFYTTLEQQWHRVYVNSTFYKDVKLITPKNRLLPWEIVRNPSPALLTSIKLYCVEDDSFNDIFENIESGEIVYYTANGKDYIQYLGSRDLTDNLPCGWYYLVATDGSLTFYSEVFVVMDFEETETNALSYDDIAEIAANDSEAIKYQ